MRKKYAIVILVVFFVTACRGKTLTSVPPATESPSAPRLDERLLCGLIAPESDSPWRQYWRSLNGLSGISALLKDGDWLWVGTPQGLARLDLQTLDCTLYEHAGADSGLSLAGVHALVLDPEGCLWAVTAQAIARTCGAGWQPVQHGFVTGLAVDAQGNLQTYTASRSAIFYRYQGHVPPAEGQWQGKSVFYQEAMSDDCADWFSKSYPYRTERFQSPQECQALTAWRQRLAALEPPAGLELLEFPLAAGGESVWMFARRVQSNAHQPDQYALLRFSDEVDGGGWQVVSWPYAPPKGRTVMVADEARSGVWIASSDGLVFSDGQTLQKMPLIANDLLPVRPPVTDLTSDHSGRLWAATHEGLFRLDEGAGRYELTEIGDSVLVAPDDQGGLWAFSRYAGGQVGHYVPSGDPDGGRWEYHPAPGFCTPRDIAADVGGGLWMTGFGCDLMGFDGQQWVPYGGGSDVWGALLERGPDGELYAARRDDRIQRYDGATWEILPAPDRHHYEEVEALAIDRRGGLWIAYRVAPYLRYWDDSQWRAFPDTVSGPVYALLVDAQGDLWAGGERALLHYDGENWESIPAGDHITALADDEQGRIWAAGPDGLYVYDPAGEGAR